MIKVFISIKKYIINDILYYWFLLTNNPAKAIAIKEEFFKKNNVNYIYILHRLGLHQTVASTPFYSGNTWRNAFSRAVSLAVCGRFEEAKNQAKNLLRTGISKQIQLELAHRLAPFTPDFAYQILPKNKGPVLLHAALMLLLGDNSRAKKLLHHEFSNLTNRNAPECHLFISNASPEKPVIQLERLNRFLSHYRLPLLSLRDCSKPPNSLNLCIDSQLPRIKGPLVSVIMTAFNAAERIETAMCSILDQTYLSLELIVVDDCSTDDTRQIVQTIAQADPRLTYIRLPKNVGTYVAKSIGLQQATGEFITCHDSDDWSHPLRIEKQVTPLLNNKKLVFTTSHWIRLQDNGIYYARLVYPLMRLNMQSLLFRREVVLRHAGAWDPVRTGADSEFLARLKLVFGHRAMRRVAQPLTIGSHRPNSLMNAPDTGYSAAGMSPTRLAYWEAWNYWHIEELRQKRLPKLQFFPQKGRQFPAPKEILVPYNDIDFCVRHTLNEPS
nr:glycosyltransferase family 2 protein [uncultured Desulfobulbus sp.]